MKSHFLDSFFMPNAVAFAGSIKPGKIGYEIIKNMKEGKFPGQIFPVNPAGGELFGYKVYSSIPEIPGDVQLVVISLPKQAIIDTLSQCGRKGIKAAVVISSGYSEVGNHEEEKELVLEARRSGIRIIGPNCAGLMNPWTEHFPSIEVRALPGYTAFITQSGALGGATLAMAEERGFGFSKFVSYGNRCDVGDIELLSYLAEDVQTRVIALYIEGVDNGRDFLRASQAASRKKPVVAIKSGRSAAGTRAASSHTGTLAGVDQIYDAAFRKAGIIRVEGIEEMFDLCQAFSHCALPRDKRVAIITNSGGPGILAADRAERLGLEVEEPSPSLQALLRPHLSPHASLNNPIDLTVESGYEEYHTALDFTLSEYDAAIVINVATPYLDSTGIARGIIDAAKKHHKPVITSFMAGRIVREAAGLLEEAQIVNLATGERCSYVMAKLMERKNILERIEFASIN